MTALGLSRATAPGWENDVGRADDTDGIDIAEIEREGHSGLGSACLRVTAP